MSGIVHVRYEGFNRRSALDNFSGSGRLDQRPGATGSVNGTLHTVNGLRSYGKTRLPDNKFSGGPGEVDCRTAGAAAPGRWP